MSYPQKILYIFDPKLTAIKGHPFNYDMMVAMAAERKNISTFIYAACPFTPDFPRIIPCLPIFKKSKLRLFARPFKWLRDQFRSLVKASFNPHNRHVQPERPRQPLRWSAPNYRYIHKMLRQAKKYLPIWKNILLDEATKNAQKHILIQDVDIADIVTLSSFSATFHGQPNQFCFHLIFRQAPIVACSRFETQQQWSQRLLRLLKESKFEIRFYADTKQIIEQYKPLLEPEISMQLLPIPLASTLILDSLSTTKQSAKEDICLGVMGDMRQEKGALLLPHLFSQLPGFIDGKRIKILVQHNPESTEKTLKEISLLLEKLYKNDLNHPQYVALADNYSTEDYLKIYSQVDISIMLYTSERYAVSSSGIMAEAVHLNVPVISFTGTSMSAVISQAKEGEGLRIGEAIDDIGEFPLVIHKMLTELSSYRTDMSIFAKQWKKFHNSDKYIDILMDYPTISRQ